MSAILGSRRRLVKRSMNGLGTALASAASRMGRHLVPPQRASLAGGARRGTVATVAGAVRPGLLPLSWPPAQLPPPQQVIRRRLRLRQRPAVRGSCGPRSEQPGRADLRGESRDWILARRVLHATPQIGRAHVCTPVTLIYLVCRLPLEK